MKPKLPHLLGQTQAGTSLARHLRQVEESEDSLSSTSRARPSLRYTRATLVLLQRPLSSAASIERVRRKKGVAPPRLRL